MSFSDGTQILLNLGPLCEQNDMYIIEKLTPEIYDQKQPVYI
jgi:hypothetical protein